MSQQSPGCLPAGSCPDPAAPRAITAAPEPAAGRDGGGLRALLADSAVGFAALSGDEFFAALKQACQDGTANPELIVDCERKITSREAGPRKLHQMLFAASDRHAWAGVRALALAAVSLWGSKTGHRWLTCGQLHFARGSE
ncbi:MAG: hypothetical protein ACRDOU_27410 [Streptosporangiaceae bacterium]